MSALRKDPCTGRWVVLEDLWPARPVEPEACPFCAGNESLTPPEIAAWGPTGRGPNLAGWEVRDCKEFCVNGHRVNFLP